MKISTRQICFILIAYTVVSKLLMYPTLLSNTSGRDLLFSAAIDFIVGGAVIWSIAYLCSRTDKTFYELLKDTFGQVVARIVFGFFAVFFLAAALLPVFEQEQYVHAIFYDTAAHMGVFLPFFLFSWYAASKKLMNTGRCADVCLPIFATAMLLLFGMGFVEADFSNLMPILKTPATKIFGGAIGSLHNFAEPCWLLMFMGRFAYKKGDAAKITLSYVGGALIMLAFLAMFYSIYGPISPSRTFAIARTSLFFPAIEMIGRVDLLLLFALEVVSLFAIAINIQLAVHAAGECTGYKNYPVISLVFNGVLLLMLVLFKNSYNAIYKIYYNWMWIAFLVFTVVIPVLCWVLKRGKRNEKKA